MKKTITKAAQKKLANWFAARPVFALMGEYSAGKSTLLNLLLDREALPTKVTATNLPPVWLTHSATPTYEGLLFNGKIETVDLEQLGEDVREKYVLLRMGLDAEPLEHADIIDTPGISDPKLAKGALTFLGDYIDIVIWCSPANQAWRQTEKVAWSAFPEHLREQGLLLLTRADKLRAKSDLKKVVKRCQQEAGDLFRKILTLETTRAASVDRAERFEAEDNLWTSSGAASVEKAFAEALASAEASQAKRQSKTKPVAQKAPVAKAKPAAPKPEPSKPEAPKPAVAKKKSEVHSKSATGKSLSWHPEHAFSEGLSKLGDKPQKSQILSLIGQLKDTISNHEDLSEAHKVVLLRCLHVDENMDFETNRLVAQIKCELSDFSHGPWFDLAQR